MTRPTIITVAITGALPRKVQTPAVPVTPSEQIESTHEAFEAGAALVHIHVRNKDESPSSDPQLFAQVQEGVRKHCPGMIVQFSTGGRGRNQQERGRSLSLRPDMASLATGSVNFPTQIYENPPQLVEELASTMLEYNVKPEIEVFGRHQLEINRWALELGGHLRTGLEDNIKFDRDRLAKSNAELVARVRDLCGEYDRRAATPTEARNILGLAPV